MPKGAGRREQGMCERRVEKELVVDGHHRRMCRRCRRWGSEGERTNRNLVSRSGVALCTLLFVFAPLVALW